MNIKHGADLPKGRHRLNLLDAVWHLLNLLAPGVLVPLFATLLAKVVWRKALATRALPALMGPACAAGVGVVLAGLVLHGRDGKMATYVTLVLVTAVMLWWRGLRRRT